jgi:hypothetical protein
MSYSGARATGTPDNRLQRTALPLNRAPGGWSIAMARIDGVFNDFARYVTSGLSGFITSACDACERAQTMTLLLSIRLVAGCALTVTTQGQ